MMCVIGQERGVGVASWRVFTATFCAMVREEVGLTLASLFLLSQIVEEYTFRSSSLNWYLGKKNRKWLFSEIS
jgi:hypothetical protein